MKEIKKLLVANRAEIALRIIRTAKALGIKTVAVFSEADKTAAHVAAADEAVSLGSPEASRSYLNIAAIIDAARRVKADAIHPGYGFLSERADFAKAVADAGIIFVGPPASALALAGDKIGARKIAMECAIPVVPGGEVEDLSAARALAARLGFPVVVKAAAGGGGRGMRVVRAETELEEALEAGAREAKQAFGDGRVYLEKFLARPRHVEVQLLCDAYGRVVVLGERECSVQRRHQKLIEESPSPVVDDELRSKMAQAAIKLAQRTGYVNAGTVEFLLDGREFYFLEINARLQVEHPVTELRFNCDLVAEQLKLAAGEPVRDRWEPRGHALECRIYAEDPELGFRPATGEVLYVHKPEGPGVRVDSWIEPGSRITPYYDGLLAKVITYGEDREQARRRMAIALEELVLAGVPHTGGFLRDIVLSEPFIRGELSTRLIDEQFATWRPDQQALRVALAMAATAFVRRIDLTQSATGPTLNRRADRSPWVELRGFVPWS